MSLENLVRSVKGGLKKVAMTGLLFASAYAPFGCGGGGDPPSPNIDPTIATNVTSGTPSGTPVTSVTIPEGNVMELNFVVDDPDGNFPITFVVSGALPPFLTYDGATKTISGVANYTDSGTYPIQLVAQDSRGGNTLRNLDLIVSDVASPPRIISIKNDGAWKLVHMYPDGSNEVEIAAPANFKGRPRWYPGDQTLITYFRSDGGSAGFDPRLANADGTGEQKIVDNPDVDKIQPVISPDKTLVTYTSAQSTPRAIYLADWNDTTKTATNVRKLNSNTNEALWSVFSFDSQWVYYSADKSGNFEVCRFRSDQTGLEENLTNNPANDFVDDLSADGTKLLFRSDRTGGIRKLYIANPDGTGVTPLTNNLADAFSGNFSPDSKKVVYELSTDLYIIHTDGRFNRMITSGSFDYYDPDW